MITAATANAQYYIKGTAPGDTITFSATGYSASSSITTIAQFTSNPGGTALAAAIVAADGAISTAFGTASFTYAGNTYLVSDTTAAAAGTNLGNLAGVTVIELAGLHTFGSNVGGVTTILT